MNSNDQPFIAELFISFLRLGVTAFGGPSMVASIRTMAVEKKSWLDAETFNNGVALCQTIPGATAMQAAAYVGLKTRGAQEFTHLNPDTINQIYVRVVQATMVDDVVQQSRAALSEVSATTEQSIVQVMGGIAMVSQRFAGVASFVALLGGLILTGLTLSASVAERKREIGVMKAVGWTAAEVRRYFISEGLAISTA